MPPRKTGPFFFDLVTGADQRLKNQADRRSPPGLFQRAVLKALDTRPTNSKFAGTQALARDGRHKKFNATLSVGPAVMELHVLSDEEEHGNDWIKAGFNPSEIQTSIKAQWAEHVIPGRSDRPMHYVSTENLSMKFELFWDAAMPGLRGGAVNPDASKLTGEGITPIDKARNFVMALPYPLASTATIQLNAPPRVLFFWPGYLSLTGVVMSVDIRDEDWWAVPNGVQLRRFRASFDVRAIRDVRSQSKPLDFKDVKLVGMQRDKLPGRALESSAGDEEGGG